MAKNANKGLQLYNVAAEIPKYEHSLIEWYMHACSL